MAKKESDGLLFARPAVKPMTKQAACGDLHPPTWAIPRELVYFTSEFYQPAAVMFYYLMNALNLSETRVVWARRGEKSLVLDR